MAIPTLCAIPDKARTENICSRCRRKSPRITQDCVTVLTGVDFDLLASSTLSTGKDTDSNDCHSDSRHSSLVVSRITEELPTHGITVM